MDDDSLLPLFASSAPADDLEEKLRRVSEENRRLAATLGAILADHPHLRSLAASPAPAIAAAAAPNVVSREEILGVTAEPQPKIRTVSVRADPSDSDSNLSVKDGYHWKKYGQKVTRDNRHPRGYFRCAFAPSCPVKKKVQRDAEDTSMLVATYEGEHNHAQSPAGEFVGDESTGQAGSLPCSISFRSSGRMVTLDPTNQSAGPRSTMEVFSREVITPEFQRRLVVEMVNWLVNDAEFMRGLTNAVAEKILENFPDRLS